MFAAVGPGGAIHVQPLKFFEEAEGYGREGKSQYLLREGEQY